MTRINGQELILIDTAPGGFQEAGGPLFDAALDRFMTSRGQPPANESWLGRRHLRHRKLHALRKRWRELAGEDEEVEEEL